jgi:hypothetical protein
MGARVSQTYIRLDPTARPLSRSTTLWGCALAGALLLSTAGAAAALFGFWRAIQACV